MSVGIVLAVIAAGLGQGTWEDRALTVANRVWDPPCRPQVQVSAPPDDYYRYALGWADPTTCTVHINVYGEALDAYEPYCTVVLHEVGHLSGAQHNHNDRSVMREEMMFNSGRVRRNGRWVTRWSGTDPRCDRHQRAR